MTHDTIGKTSNTPMKKRIAVGAAAVLTAGALLGVGVAGASADTLPAPTATATAAHAQAHMHANAHGERAHSGIDSIARQIRSAFFQNKVDGVAAQKFAALAIGQTELFSKLPAALQADLTTLKNASSTERDADAQKIATTALDGGYGAKIQRMATALKSGVKHSTSEVTRDSARTDSTSTDSTSSNKAGDVTGTTSLSGSAKKTAATTHLDAHASSGAQAMSSADVTVGR